MNNHQGGYSLTELLVAILITGAIAGVLATSVYQFTVVSKHGTERLTALDETQNAARWLLRDIRTASGASTPTACAIDCTSLTLQVPTTTGTITYDTPTAPEIYGTIAYRTVPGTIYYRNIAGDLVRQSGSPAITQTIVARDIEATFSTMIWPGTPSTPGTPGTHDRIRVTMNTSVSLQDSEDVNKVFHGFIRAVED